MSFHCEHRYGTGVSTHADPRGKVGRSIRIWPCSSSGDRHPNRIVGQFCCTVDDVWDITVNGWRRLAVTILIADAALSPLLRPIDSSLTQQMIASDHRQPANALHGMQYEITYLLGPLLGGLLATQHVILVALSFT